MDNLFKKLKELQGISSTNLKKEFIKSNKTDILFRDTLFFLLNPYIVTNISKAKINKKVKPFKTSRQLENLWDMYKFLENECTGKDKDIFILQSFLETCKYKDEVKELITKSMRLGVQAKLVNSALGEEFIPQFGVQLATSYDKCKNKFKNEEIIITEKLDGQKMIAIKQNDKVTFYSRQGKELTGLIEITKDILNINKDSFVLDGELISEENFNDSALTYKDTMKKASIKGDKIGLKYMVYDYIENINDFFKGKDETPCKERKEKIKNLIENSKVFHLEYHEPWYIGYNINKIEELLLKADDEHKEGICVNVAKSPYVTKRTPYLAKCKSFKTADCLVYDIFEGENAFEGMLGGIKLKAIYNGEIIYSDCGSGFNQEERKYYWEHKNELINKIVTIKYFEVSENTKTKIKSLRFCTWLGSDYIRTDKEGLDSTNVD